ncbi:MAG: thiamine pyrophosphate-binding protein [Lachnospiraceae bacterium]
MIKLSDYVIKYLETLNIGHMFMIPGGGAMHLNDSLGKSNSIKYVVCLHEQACAIAAEAYARVNNKLGLLMVTTGPGGTNAITGVAAAYVESTPMLILSGQVKIMDQIRNQRIRQQGMQELDIVSIVTPISKYAEMVTNPTRIRYHLEKAIYLATHDRKGPVWLDIPLDIQATMIDEKQLEGYVPKLNIRKRESEYEKLEQQVLKIIELFNESDRPVLLAGNGIRLADGIEQFNQLIELLQIPILTTWNGIDLIEEEHPLSYGRPGGMGQRYANLIQQNSDWLLSIGARLNLLQTGYNFEGFAREATKIMVDIDEPELHKINVRPDIAVCADAKLFIQLILKHRDRIARRERKQWISYADDMKSKYPVVLDKYWKQEKLVNTYALLDTITEEMEPNDIYVSGSSGTCVDVSMQTFRVKKGQRVFSTKGLASMGFGLPATIGACLAGNRRRTICVCGDGGFQMNIQELETIHRLQLPIKIFVLNNNGYAQIHATQTNVFFGHFVACDDTSGLSIPCISDIAKAYKLATMQICSNAELQQKVQQTLDYDGPIICEVFVPITLSAFPKQVSYKRKDGQMESLPLEYMAPPLNDDELQKNMLITMFQKGDV